MRNFAGAAILLDGPPEVEIVGELVYFTDRCGDDLVIRRVMRRSVAIKTFAEVAKMLRATRIGAEIVELEERRRA